MSPWSASGGASALNGSPWIIVSAARARWRSSATAMSFSLLLSVWAASRGSSEIGILERRIASVVERADSLHPVGMDGRPPVRVHHDRDGLLDRLTLSEPHGALRCLDGGGRVAGDLLGDAQGSVEELVLRVDLVDHAEAVGLLDADRVARHQHLQR